MGGRFFALLYTWRVFSFILENKTLNNHLSQTGMIVRHNYKKEYDLSVPCLICLTVLSSSVQTEYFGTLSSHCFQQIIEFLVISNIVSNWEEIPFSSSIVSSENQWTKRNFFWLRVEVTFTSNHLPLRNAKCAQSIHISFTVKHQLTDTLSVAQVWPVHWWKMS